MKISPKVQAIITSYLRNFLGTALAVYASGVHDWQAVLAAGLGAVVPVLLRSLNPKDPAFGIVADTVAVELQKVATKAPKKTTK